MEPGTQPLPTWFDDAKLGSVLESIVVGVERVRVRRHWIG